MHFPDASPPSSGAGHIIDALPRCKSSKQWCRPQLLSAAMIDVFTVTVVVGLRSIPISEPLLWLLLVANGHQYYISVTRKGWKEGNVLFNNALNTLYFMDIWSLRHMVTDDTDSKRLETHCHHICYSFWLAARVLLYASFHRQDNTYHSLCFTSRGALAAMRNSSMGPLVTRKSPNHNSWYAIYWVRHSPVAWPPC